MAVGHGLMVGCCCQRTMVVVLAMDQPPTKTSNYAHFRWRLVMVVLSVADIPLRLVFRAREGVCQWSCCWLLTYPSVLHFVQGRGCVSGRVVGC